MSYDEAAFEFRLAGRAVGLDDVMALDEAGQICWRALELRDWMRRIDADALARCRRQALGDVDLDALTPEQRVIADAARDDGVLAGKLVDADPALVQAVADELLRRGLVTPASSSPSGGVAGQPGCQPNPLAEMDLPRGMEPLSQLERAREPGRPMTRAEKRLMKHILKQDDKEKARRERREAEGRADR